MNTIIISTLCLLYAILAAIMLLLASKLQKERRLSKTLSEKLDRLNMDQEAFGAKFMELRDDYVEEVRKNIKSYRSRHGIKVTAKVNILRTIVGAKQAYKLYSNALVDYMPEFDSKYYVVGHIEDTYLILGCDSFAAGLSLEDVMKFKPNKIHRRKYPSYQLLCCNEQQYESSSTTCNN